MIPSRRSAQLRSAVLAVLLLPNLIYAQTQPARSEWKIREHQLPIRVSLERARGTGPENRDVPAPLRRQVFALYGMPSADPKSYEVDYLITPALGGADDIGNLWPQSDSATAWNARVKDALEDRLHELVCSGDVDLPTAQREIATDWIAAYKKYFHTDKPIN